MDHVLRVRAAGQSQQCRPALGRTSAAYTSDRQELLITEFGYNVGGHKMAMSIFGTRIVHSGAGPLTQINRKSTPTHLELQQQVSFAQLGWSETSHVQPLLRAAAVWEDFPAVGYKLVRSEFKAGDEDQRLDLLYLRDDGALLPCELKIGGRERDTVGQLLRYIADLSFQTIDLDWLCAQHDELIKSLGYIDAVHDNIRGGFKQFLTKHRIENRQVRFLPRAGLIIDEAFPSQLRKTIRYLNEYCGFTIRTLQMNTFVDPESCIHPHLGNYLFRIDLFPVD